jgi:hypothetical protein
VQVSDIDGTMIGGDGDWDADAGTERFRTYWEEVAALGDSVLVYNTGRSVGQVAQLFREKAGRLAVPDALITAVGTKVGALAYLLVVVQLALAGAVACFAVSATACSTLAPNKQLAG